MAGSDPSPELKGPTVAASANQCLESFQQCLISASSVHPREVSMVEDQLARFSSWATSIGVFAPGSASMDHRLRYASEVHGVVTGLLESMNYRVQTCCKALAQLAESSTTDASTVANERLGQSFLDIAAEITRLNKISNTIRRASKDTQVLKASNFHIKDDEGKDVEPLLLSHFEHHIGDWFPGISDTIRQRLARAMLLRRRRILYRRHRQGNTSIRSENTISQASVILPDAQSGAVSQVQAKSKQQDEKAAMERPAAKLAPSQVRSATTLAAEKFKMVSSTLSIVSASRTIASGKHQTLTYPPAPGFAAKRRYEKLKSQRIVEAAVTSTEPSLQELLESDLRAIGEITCPYCLYALPAAEVFDERKWRNHVKNDLDPYVCLFEDCDQPDVLYTHSDEWLGHLHQHGKVWRCSSHREMGPFSTLEDYMQHMREVHDTKLSDRQLRVVANRNSRKTTKLFPSCPLCGRVESEVDGRFEDHLAGHLRSLALKSLPSYQDEILDDVGDGNNSINGSRPRSRSTLRELEEEKEEMLRDGTGSFWDHWSPQLTQGISVNFLGDVYLELDLGDSEAQVASLFFDTMVFKESSENFDDDPILQSMLQRQLARIEVIDAGADDSSDLSVEQEVATSSKAPASETSGQDEVDDAAPQQPINAEPSHVQAAISGQDTEVTVPAGNKGPEPKPTTQSRPVPEPDLVAFLEEVELSEGMRDKALRLVKGEREAIQRVVNAKSVDGEAAAIIRRLKDVDESNAVKEENMEDRGFDGFDRAMSFVNWLKDRLQDKPEVYSDFFEILRTHEREKTPVDDVCAQLSALFDSAPDLLEKLNQFLPESSSQTKQDARPQNKDILCRNVLIYGHCRYEDQGCAFNHDPENNDSISETNPRVEIGDGGHNSVNDDGTDSVSQTTRPPAAPSIGSMSPMEEEDPPDRRKKRASGVYVNGNKVLDLNRRDRRPPTKVQTPSRSFETAPSGTSSGQIPPRPGTTFDNQGAAASAPQAWYAPVPRAHQHDLGSSSVPMAFEARITENYPQQATAGDLFLPPTPSYSYPDDAFEADVEAEVSRPPRRKTRTPAIYVDGKKVVDLDRENSPVGSLGARIVTVDGPKEGEAAEVVKRYKREERERIAKEKAEKEAKEQEYDKRLRQDVAKSELDAEAIDAIMKRDKTTPWSTPRQPRTTSNSAPSAMAYAKIPPPRPVIVEERPRVQTEIVDNPRPRRHRHTSDVPSSTRSLKEESTHPRHSSDVPRSTRSINDDYEKQRRQRLRSLERRQQEERAQRFRARINEANAKISGRPPLPPIPQQEERAQRLRARINEANAEISGRPPLPPIPRRSSTYRRPPVEVLDPEVKEEGKGKGPSVKVPDREAELVEAVRRLKAEQERYEEEAGRLSQKEEGKGKEKEGEEKQPSVEFPKRAELVEAIRQLDFERERREDEAPRRARKEEKEEEESQRRRLMERMMPKRHSTVNPGSRRTLVLYNDGTYRWE
ncbi:hypothetical protein QQX98_000044 [Neonectria punicea]|uniref:C3H1-type domain-containing protein n=1 Tax=Neonectria punicea TaxID=979145 RepID=A0ABR1HV72_9HYPO